MIRTTTLLLAGSLLTAAGCKPAVYGERSYRSHPLSAPEGNDFPKTHVSGTPSFHNRVSGPTDTTAASSDAPSDHVITSTRTESVTTTPPQDTPRDEVARSRNTTGLDPPAPAAPVPVAVTPPPAPVHTPTPPPADRPAVTAHNDTKPTPPRDANVATRTVMATKRPYVGRG